jgi:hypothetical protein
VNVDEKIYTDFHFDTSVDMVEEIMVEEIAWWERYALTRK